MKHPQLLAFVVLLLPSNVFPQLLGCPDVGCPMYGGSADCQLDNVKATAIGVSKVNSSLSKDPVTWTVATGRDLGAERNDSDLAFYRRNFYLGQPPTLQLQEADSVKGCAIFFEGISGVLRFPHSGDEGTCSDALTESCVSDWMEQVNSIISQNATDLDCNDLGKTLQASPPDTCATLHGSWGEVTSRTIAGLGSPGPIRLEECIPTISRDYSVSPVESFNLTARAVASPLLSNFIDGITPVITIFVPGTAAQNNTNDGPTISAPEAHLNCLKVTEGSNGAISPGEVSSGTSVPPALSYDLLTISFGALLALLIFQF